MSARSFDSATAERSSAGWAAVEPRVERGTEPAQLSDQALVGLIAAEDEVALAELYDRFGAIAYGLAVRIAGDHGLAEEAVLDAFLSVWRSASRFDVRRCSARVWLLTLVHRRASDLAARADSLSSHDSARA